MAASPPPPPPPPEATLGTPRYVYLLGRLRNRQITMEEATELFAIQQSMIRSASRPSASPPAPGGPGATPAPTTAGGIAMVSDEGLALALLAVGTASGVLAAVLKRGRDGPRSDAPSAR